MNKSNKYVLIFWPQSNEYSIEREDKVKKVIKFKVLKPGWCGELPWLEKNSVDIYEAKIVEVSRKYKKKLFCNKCEERFVNQNNFLTSKAS